MTNVFVLMHRDSLNIHIAAGAQWLLACSVWLPPVFNCAHMVGK